MRATLLLLLSLCGLVVACGDDEKPRSTVSVGRDGGGPGRDGGPTAGVGGGTGTGGSGGTSDAGDPSGDEDSGMSGDGDGDGEDLAILCDDVEPAPVDGADRDPGRIYNGVSLPLDLRTTRAEAAWEAGCADPMLRITISDGGCSEGNGHELTFWVPAAGVENGSIVIGQNTIAEEPTAGSIRVRYTRPTRLTPNGVWGTCEDASGTLDIIGELSLRGGRHVQATFLLDLTRCDDGEASTQPVNGEFNVELPASLVEVCP